MPGNIITINESIKYYVGDSKMNELTDWLETNGHKEK